MFSGRTPRLFAAAMSDIHRIKGRDMRVFLSGFLGIAAVLVAAAGLFAALSAAVSARTAEILMCGQIFGRFSARTAEKPLRGQEFGRFSARSK